MVDPRTLAGDFPLSFHNRMDPLAKHRHWHKRQQSSRLNMISSFRDFRLSVARGRGGTTPGPPIRVDNLLDSGPHMEPIPDPRQPLRRRSPPRSPGT